MQLQREGLEVPESALGNAVESGTISLVSCILERTYLQFLNFGDSWALVEMEGNKKGEPESIGNLVS